ncbi:MAG: arylamine N-acetyltransferase, partial [Alphaproteobacteria bacterium]|nr:arylamine N-acetyltransferase [Alphaproteobacteria bacterium]
MAIDLDGYFGRIGYAGAHPPTLETLRAIARLHPQAIPFENLDPLMGRPVRLDPASLERKLVTDGRGGYCFEHGLLLKGVLEALGFAVTGLSARTIWGLPPGTPTARAHMLLRVDMGDETYLVDAGFGIAALTAPLALVTDVEQDTPHETYRLLGSEGGLFELQVRLGTGWRGLYVFDLQGQLDADYEVTNWYASTYPGSGFLSSLMAARADLGCRHTLRDNRYTLRSQASADETRLIESVAEMR